MSKHKAARSFLATVALTFLVMQAWFALCCSSKSNANVDAKPPAAPTPAESRSEDRVTLFDPALSFIPPEGFKTLNIKQLKIKLPDNEHPRNIFADTDQSGYVIVTYLDDQEMAPEDLAKAKEFTEHTQRDLAPWINSEIAEMNGRQWWHFETEDVVKSELEELTEPGKAGKEKGPPEPRKDRLHRDSYSTIFKNKLLRFTFEAPPDDYAKLKVAFAQSIRSIQIKEER